MAGTVGTERKLQMLVACKDLQAKYIIRGLQGKMRIGLTATTVMGESQARLLQARFVLGLCL